MIRSQSLTGVIAGLLVCLPVYPALADDGATEESSFVCSGFDSAFSPLKFSLSLGRNAGDHSISFHEVQSGGLFGTVENVEHIAQTEGSEEDEYFVVDNGQKLRLSIQKEGTDSVIALVRGTHPSNDPTFTAIARCERISEELSSTSMFAVGRAGPANKRPGRPIRVSQPIGFACLLLDSPEQRAMLNLVPDRGNSFSDKAEFQMSDSLQSGTASVMGETLDGVQAFRAIVSTNDANIIFTTNGKTGWVRTLPKAGSDLAPDYGVCRNLDSASGKSD